MTGVYICKMYRPIIRGPSQYKDVVLTIRRSRDCLIFNMGIPIAGKTVFILRWGSDGSNTPWMGYGRNKITLDLSLIGKIYLTHWGRVTHVCVSKLTTIGSDNGLSPGRRQAIIWTNAGILLIGPLGTNFSENLIGIQTFKKKNALENAVCKMASILSRPQCVKL